MLSDRQICSICECLTIVLLAMAMFATALFASYLVISVFVNCVILANVFHLRLCSIFDCALFAKFDVLANVLYL